MNRRSHIGLLAGLVALQVGIPLALAVLSYLALSALIVVGGELDRRYARRTGAV